MGNSQGCAGKQAFLGKQIPDWEHDGDTPASAGFKLPRQSQQLAKCLKNCHLACGRKGRHPDHVGDSEFDPGEGISSVTVSTRGGCMDVGSQGLRLCGHLRFLII